MQKITVIGTGYVGLIAGLGFAKWGNEVVCLDLVPEKIEKLQKGVCPIYEPGAEVQLSDGLSSGRLRFTCDVKEAVEHGDLIFIAVGTPEAPDGSADLKYVYSAVDEIADYMQSYKLVVDKSTVPVGTARALLADGRYTVRMYDPKAMENAMQALGSPSNAVWCRSAQETTQGADAVVIATEWAEFGSLDFDDLKRNLRKPVLFDLRNVYPKEYAQAAKIEYHGTGI